MTGAAARPDETSIHPDVGAAFARLDEAGVRWLVLRGRLDGSHGDIDLLAAPDDLARLESALVSVGFRPRHAPEHRPHRFFVRWSGSSNRWIVLDVVPAIPGKREPRERQDTPGLLLRSRRDVQGIPRPHPADDVRLRQLRAGSEGDRGAYRRDTRRRRGLGRRVRGLAALAPADRRGISLAVLGPDGAGKSTLVAALEDTLPFAVQPVYLGVFRTSDRVHALRRIPGLGLVSRWWTLRLRSVRASHDLRLGRVVVFDRHAVDALLRPGRPTVRSRVSYALLARACRTPDLFVVLDAPGEVMFARKGEHSVEILEERRHRYRELAQRYPNVAIVDATQSPDTVLHQVEALVWRTYAGRTP